MKTYYEKIEESKKYIKELEKFRNTVCAKNETCSTCPLYGVMWNESIDACWAIYHLRDLILNKEG